MRAILRIRGVDQGILRALGPEMAVDWDRASLEARLKGMFWK